jgi:hypothetical protein
LNTKQDETKAGSLVNSINYQWILPSLVHNPISVGIVPVRRFKESSSVTVEQLIAGKCAGTTKTRTHTHIARLAHSRTVSNKDGNSVGLVEGLDEGPKEGFNDGMMDGSDDGASLGVKLGAEDGSTDGLVEGIDEGSKEGFNDGC